MEQCRRGDLDRGGALLHVDVVVLMVPDGLDTEVLGTTTDQLGISQLMTSCRRVYKERRTDVTLTSQYQHPRVYTLAVQHVDRRFL